MRQVRTARDCALSLLEYRDRTEAEVRRKLKEREYDPEAVEETIVFLKEYHYLENMCALPAAERVSGSCARVCRTRGFPERYWIFVLKRRQWMRKRLSGVF